MLSREFLSFIGALKRMAKNDKDDQKKTGWNQYGQFRAPAGKLKRIGDEVVVESSNNTVGAVKLDYPVLFEEVHQLDRFVSSKRKTGSEPSADDVIAAFSGRGILVGDEQNPGYAKHSDIEKFLRERPTLFEYARNLLADRWGLKPQTIDSYLKPSRGKRKKP
jgi:hypothetical protein